MSSDIYNAKNMDVHFSNGDYITSLSLKMARDQKVSAEDIEMLKDTHIMRALIFSAMKRTDNTTTLKNFAKMFEKLEFLQQELWGFKKDRSWHRWFEVPKCTCPKHDNAARVGSEENVMDSTCPIHGKV
jgi:hypothetical protein